MEANDAALVALARSGDSDAFRVLVERHSRKLFRLAYRLTGREQDAEDVVQETFLRAYRGLDRFHDQAVFGSWLYRIASNYALDVLRTRKPREPESDGDFPLVERLAATQPGPERLAQDRQSMDKLRDAMNRLTAQERSAFTLRHFEGYSVEEIGRMLELNSGAVRHAVFRAVQKVRRAMGDV